MQTSRTSRPRLLPCLGLLRMRRQAGLVPRARILGALPAPGLPMKCDEALAITSARAMAVQPRRRAAWAAPLAQPGRCTALCRPPQQGTQSRQRAPSIRPFSPGVPPMKSWTLWSRPSALLTGLKTPRRDGPPFATPCPNCWVASRRQPARVVRGSAAFCNRALCGP